MSFRDIAAILVKKEAAVNGDGSGNGNGIRVVAGNQQQLANGSSHSNEKSDGFCYSNYPRETIMIEVKNLIKYACMCILYNTGLDIKI
jgi:hypothetical protein